MIQIKGRGECHQDGRNADDFSQRRTECARDCGLARTLDYSITFLQRPAAYIYFDDACLVCAQACGRHRNAASYFSEAHLASLSRCCKVQCIILIMRANSILSRE